MASKYIQKFPIPTGFPEILHDLSKEILRHNPDDIIDFCACYFRCLQDNIVLNYEKKGKKIPCDFDINNPKMGKIKNSVSDTKRNLTKQDEINHTKAVEQSKIINDPARFIEEITKSKYEKESKILKGESQKMENITIEPNPNDDQLLKMSIEFVDSVIETGDCNKN